MAHDVVVFLGPTLPVTEAENYLDAVYLPPVQQGGVFRAVVDHRPAILAIIDGVFAQRPAVRHKEILWAMAAGVEVHGASSMGALRAAELAPNGMVGHGLVYRWYRSTLLADDEDVAVAMAPPELGSAALGEALINMRLTFRHAERRGIISRPTRDALERLARSQYFVDRHYRSVIEAARATLPPGKAAELDALEGWLLRNAIDRKRLDAVTLLHHLARRRRERLPRHRSRFELTEAWAADLEAASQWDEYLEHGRAAITDDRWWRV
jgi:hypothetical protein